MFPRQENPTGGGTCHIVAMPYPGRGHINPMMNLCHSLSTKHPNILITFILTEEWLDLIGETTTNGGNNIRFATLPNVIPSELVRGKDFKGFVEAVFTKLPAPFEKVLDGLLDSPPLTAIIADTYLPWICEIGSRRGIPVASLWTMSAAVFSILFHFDLIRQHRHYPVEDFSEIEEETVDYIPGLPPTRIVDLHPFLISRAGVGVMDKALESVFLVSKLQYLLFTSPYELEPQLFDALKTHFQIPVYPIGPSIPHLKLDAAGVGIDYFRWLDAQPKGSVLYISMGSFLSASESQTEEIVTGVVSSGVRFLLVARGDAMVAAAAAAGGGEGGKGMVVPWCDQLRVLCHRSVGGFWTHCGLNSTLEGVYAGVPMLCWPLWWDQIPNCKAIVEDWKIGWRVQRRRRSRGEGEELMRREEVAAVVKRFMDAEEENDEVLEMRKRALELREVCRAAAAVGGSSDLSLDSFVRDISK
ncbi:UDP-glycosyltransferase 87A2 [Linum grandiflorum]